MHVLLFLTGVKRNQSDARAFGQAAAKEAFDQRDTYETMDVCIAAYAQNVRDTMREYAATVENTGVAVNAFDVEMSWILANNGFYATCVQHG